MLRNKNKFIFWLTALGLAWPSLAWAHEAYVLPYAFFWQGIAEPLDTSAFQSLQNPSNVKVTLIISVGVAAVFLLNFLFRSSRLGRAVHGQFERLSYLGPIFIRVAIAIAFYESAKTGAFLGPELTLQLVPYAEVMRMLLFAVSFMVLFGFATEVAAIIALIVFTIGFTTFGSYLFTYLNYFGEVIVLLLFGIRKWSIDAAWLGQLSGWRAKWKKYDTVIVRIFYGIALMYAGITVKLLHANLTLRVIHDWDLTKFYWLFPHDPLLVVLGGGLAEATIGLFILLGFQMRLTVLISLFYITLSLLFFRELVWPHILLYGISFNLLVQPETFTLDYWLFGDSKSKIAPWRKRLFAKST